MVILRIGSPYTYIQLATNYHDIFHRTGHICLRKSFIIKHPITVKIHCIEVYTVRCRIQYNLIRVTVRISSSRQLIQTIRQFDRAISNSYFLIIMYSCHIITFITRPITRMQFTITVSHRTPLCVVTRIITTKNPSPRHLVLYTSIVENIRVSNKARQIQFVLFCNRSQEFRCQFFLDFRIQSSHIQDCIVKCQFHSIQISQHFFILIRVLQSAQPVGQSLWFA